MITPITVTCQRRSFFEIEVVNPYLYSFSPDVDDSTVPNRFLRIPSTIYFEYGGTHDEALNDLTDFGFSDIVTGNEL